MKPKYEDSKFKIWLDNLQQESWQLELIISGVAIFGLISAFDPWREYSVSFLDRSSGSIFLMGAFGSTFTMVYLSLVALTSCLILHIVLRGLWIGAIGLRYFSGDIDYESLRYTSKFTTYLQKKIGSFDKYISKLEDFCSLIFAISFLLVFFFLSFFISILIASVPFVLFDTYLSESVGIALSRGLIIIIGFSYLVTFLDFFTQGYFKKKQWLAFFYFPIYRVMSKITFSFIYRPLLYNLLDNKYGKRILLLLVPVFFLIISVLGFSINQSNYHVERWSSKPEYASMFNYLDEMEDSDDIRVRNVAIPSRIIFSRSLPVFLKHKQSIEDAIFIIDTTLRPEKDRRGIAYSSFINVSMNTDLDSLEYNNFKRFVRAFNKEVVTIKIDTIEEKAAWILGRNKKRQIGYETVLDLADLNPGLHHLEISVKGAANDSVKTAFQRKIPFWYYPE